MNVTTRFTLYAMKKGEKRRQTMTTQAVDAQLLFVTTWQMVNSAVIYCFSVQTKFPKAIQMSILVVRSLASNMHRRIVTERTSRRYDLKNENIYS